MMKYPREREREREREEKKNPNYPAGGNDDCH